MIENCNMIKLLIFDLDGVLVDACEWHRVSLNKALKEICDYEISLEEHYKTYNGIPTRKKLEKLSEKGVVSECDHEKVYNRKQELTIEVINNLAYIRKEKIDLLNYLKSRNILVACYTNSIRKTADLMLKKTGIFEMFDYILTNQDVVNPKPSPEGYNFLVEYFKLKKDQVLIIEDSPKGIESAKKSGCKLLKVNNPDEVNIKKIREIIQ